MKEGFDLSTTEGITRFLRNKKTTLSDIYDTSVKLLENDSHYYLPQKEKFIFELLCDRLSNQGLPELKKDIKTWRLFELTWIKFSGKDTMNMRDMVLRRTKLNDIFTKSFEAIDDVQVLNQAVACIQLALDESKVAFTQNQSIEVIAKLLEFGTGLDVVCSVFDLCNGEVVKYSKKNLNQFCASCLPNLLIQSESYPQLKDIVKRTLLDPANLPDCKTNLGFFINNAKAQGRVGTKELVLLFQMVVPSMAIPDIEEVFSDFMKRFPDSTADLLKEVVKLNKTLSTKFLSTLVLHSLRNPGDNSNDVIIQSLTRNPDVGVKFGKNIFERVLRTTDTSVQQDLLKTLFKCYFGSREVDKFITLWKKYIPLDTGTEVTSLDFAESCSLPLAGLPSAQLYEITKDLVNEFKYEPKNNALPIISIVKGLIYRTADPAHSISAIATTEKLKPLFIDLLNFDQREWTVYSYIFMLYDLEELDTDFANYLKYYKSENSPAYFYTVFRIIEQDPSHYSKKVMAAFVKSFVKSSDNDYKSTIFSRWCVLLNHFLDEKDLKKLVKVLFESDFVTETLSNPLIHEQKKLISIIIDELIQQIKVKAIYFDCIPTQCLSKKQRGDTTNALYKLATSKCSDDVKVSTRKTMLRLLEIPTSLSIVETDHKCLFDLISKSGPALEISKEIVSTVCLTHIRNQGVAYLKGLLEILLDKVPSSKKIASCPYLNTALVLLENCKEFEGSYKKLIDMLAAKCVKLLSKKCSNEDIIWICNCLSHIEELDSTAIEKKDIQKAIKKQGSNAEVSVQESLFRLATSLYSAYNPKYVLALFIVLGPSEENIQSVSQFLQKLSVSEFKEIWESILELEETDTYLSLQIALFNGLHKPEEGAEYELLMTKSLSGALSHGEFSDTILLHYLAALCKVIQTKGYALSQYSVELILTLIARLAKNRNPEVHTALSKMGSLIIYNQRSKLAHRMNLMALCIIELMKPLFESEDLSPVSSSRDCAAAFQRLLNDVCDSATLVYGKGGIASTSRVESSQYTLRRTLPVVILNYLDLYLQHPVNKDLRESLTNGIYSVLRVLKENEFNYVIVSADDNGKAAFRKLYEDYSRFGKWHEE